MDTPHLAVSVHATRRARRLSLPWTLAAAALLALGACDSGADNAQGEAGATTAPAEVELDPARGAAQMSRLRIEEIAHDSLPEAMKVNDQAAAQKLCNSARERMEYAAEHLPDGADDIQAAFERVEAVCSRELVILMLDDLLGRLRANPDTLDTNCIAASVLMAFAFEHRSDDDEVVGRRMAAFEICPNLEKEWDISVSGKPPQPSQPGLEPHEGIIEPRGVIKPDAAINAGDAVDAPPVEPATSPGDELAPGDAATE